MKPSSIMCGMLILINVSICTGQNKLFDAGISTKFKDAKAKFNLAFNLNKVKGESVTPIYLAAWNSKNTVSRNSKSDSLSLSPLLMPKTTYGIKPVFDVNLGSDVDISANNVVSSLLLEAQKVLGKGRYLYYTLGPALAYDRNFSTGLTYGNVGVQYSIYRTKRKAKWGRSLDLSLGLNAHSGSRLLAKSDDSSKQSSKGLFFRLVPGLYIDYQFKNASNQPKVVLNADVRAYSIFNDNGFKPNGTYPYILSSITYRIRPKPNPNLVVSDFGISLKYTYGFEEPSFRELNVLTLGLTLYGPKS